MARPVIAQRGNALDRGRDWPYVLSWEMEVRHRRARQRPSRLMPTKIWSPPVSALRTHTRRSGIAGPSGLLLDCLEVQFRGVEHL